MTTVKEIIERAYTKVNGEFELQVEGSDDYKTYLNVLNQCMEMWAHTPYTKWQSLFNMNYLLPNVVVADQLIYPVANANNITIANSPFDNVFFVNNAGVLLAKYKMVDQAFFEASLVTGTCALFSDGLHLKGIVNEILGANIRLPVYVTPPQYTSASQNVMIDSTPWLITSMAAFICDASPVPFIARNADKYYKQAEIYMKEMRENNRHRQYLVIKSVQGARNGSVTNAGDIVGLLGAQGILSPGTGGLNVLDGGSA